MFMGIGRRASAYLSTVVMSAIACLPLVGSMYATCIEQGFFVERIISPSLAHGDYQ